ncbi:polyphosphate polymerase domain-containing protein [Paenibacillus rigui]|uniref:Vacuolar transporter n=1 Tax=Paenibacillus rigui TaxID=554312 RepID=A0A229UT09_9BACL|nr:polyphosphate polymerase domain-containing protein [Paenibacillus rigui]OXM86656.1 vacuolar transporter [Paenibacillus rigui]
MHYKGRQLRHELKYYISYPEYLSLRIRLKAVMKQDKHSVDESGYHIRSLYFDDAFDTSLYEKNYGVFQRNKYRIRVYNKSDAVINLERKSKFESYISKEGLRLTRGEYDQLMGGEFEFLKGKPGGLAQDFYLECKNHLMKPRVVVDYVREAYTMEAGDVRVTFDKDLMSSIASLDIFDPDLIVRQAFDLPYLVMEVKYNNYLPDVVRRILLLDAHQRSAISKYVICREISMNYHS